MLPGLKSKYVVIFASVFLLLLGGLFLFLYFSKDDKLSDEQKQRANQAYTDSLEWINKLQAIGNDSLRPAVGKDEPVPSDTIKYPEIFPDGSYKRIFDNEVRIYREANFSSAMIATMNAGDEIKIISKSDEIFKNDKKIEMPWYEIQTQIKGETVRGYVWGGAIAFFFAESRSGEGSKQMILGGLAEYEEPGMFGGGFSIRFKLIQKGKLLSGLILEDDIGFDMTANHTEIKSDTLGTAALPGINKVFGIYNPAKVTFFSLPWRSWIFAANNKLYHLNNSDSLFLPESGRGKAGKLIRASYDGRTKKVVHTREEDWNGRGIIAGTKYIFSKKAKVYSRPSFNSKVISLLQFNDSAMEYNDAGREDILRMENVKGIQMAWSEVEFKSNDSIKLGYIWQGDFTQSKAEFNVMDGKKLKVWTGVRSASDDQVKHVVDIKLQLDTIMFPGIPFTFYGCGAMEGGPYIYPEMKVLDKRMEGVDIILKVWDRSSCEGSSPETVIYLFLINGKWSSITYLSDYDINYEIVFPDDKGGRKNAIMIYKLWSEGEKNFRELQKVYKVSKDKMGIAS